MKEKVICELNELMDYINKSDMAKRDKDYWEELLVSRVGRVLSSLRDWHFHYNRMMKYYKGKRKEK